MLISERSKAHSFPKSEKLKLKKEIEKLFRTGKAFQFGQLKFIWLLQASAASSPINFGVSIPKKKLALATQRNKAKRRIREAFRLQKSPLIAAIPQGQQLLLFIIHTDKKIPNFDEIKLQLAAGIEKLRAIIAKQVQ